MKRFLLTAFVIATVLGLFSFVSYADVSKDYLEEFKDILPGGGIDPENVDELISGVGADAILAELFATLEGRSGDIISFFLLLLGIAIILVCSESCMAIESPALKRQITAGVSTVASVMLFSKLGQVYLTIAEGLGEISAFMSSLIPIMTGVTVAGGGVNLASVEAFNMNLTLSLVERVMSSLLLPLSSSLFVLALLGGVDGGGISALSNGIRGVFKWAMGICAAILLGATSLQSMIASAADGAYIRAARHAASDMIPVVGGAVSGAMSTLMGGLAYLKSAVGVSSVALILSLALPPLVTILLYRASLSLCIFFMGFMNSYGGVRFFTAFRSALDTLLAVYVISTIIYIIEIIIFVKCGVSSFG